MVRQDTDVVCRPIVKYGGQCVLNLSLMGLGWTGNSSRDRSEAGWSGRFIRRGPSNGLAPARWLLTLRLNFRPVGERATVLWSGMGHGR
jgi:hypothetical protein